MTYPIVLSYIQTEPLLTAKRRGLSPAGISADLGLTMTTVRLTPAGVEFPGGEHLDWQSIEKISRSEVNCFLVENNSIRAIQVFSEYTNRVCGLIQ